MAVLNDFPGLYEKVKSYADTMAQMAKVPSYAIYAFFNKNGGHFPQTIDELNRFLDTPDPVYKVTRRDPATGAIRPIVPGDTPGTLGAKDPGFRHVITNAEDSDIQRFQDVDPRGVPWGGSYDAAYNQAHPELAGKSGFDTPIGQQLGFGTAPTGGRLASSLADDPNARQQIQGRAFDPSNYVAPVDPSNPSGPYVSVVNGQPNTLPNQNAAENDYNARTGGGSDQGAPPAGPGAGAAGPGSAGPAASPAAGAASGPVAFNPSAASAANAAVLAFLEQRRIDEIEKPELALKTQTELAQMRRDDAAEVWKEAFQKASLTGTIDGQPTVDVGKLTGSINGTPTLEATKQGADLTGFTGPGYAGQAQAAFERLPPEQRTPEMAATIWRNVAPGLTPQEAAQMGQAGHDYYAATGQTMPDAVAAQHLARITGGRVSGTGAQATPAFQHQQNQDAMSAIAQLANLRGPENAITYALALQNLPDSVRNTIGAAVSNLGITPRTPAQQGFLGDVTGRPAMGQPPTQTGAPAMVAAPGVGGMMPVTGPRITAPTSGVGGQPATGPGSLWDPTAASHYDIAYFGPRAAQSGEARQQIQGGAMRMDPATQAAVAARPPPPVVDARMPADPVQHGGPALVADFGPGGGRTLPTPGGGDFGMPPVHRGPVLVGTPGVGGAPGGPRTLPTPGGADFGMPPGGVYGPRTQPAGLPNFAQMSPTDWARTNPYAQKVTMDAYNNSGQDPQAIMDEYRARLPRATGPRTGRLRVA